MLVGGLYDILWDHGVAWAGTRGTRSSDEGLSKGLSCSGLWGACPPFDYSMPDSMPIGLCASAGRYRS